MQSWVCIIICRRSIMRAWDVGSAAQRISYAIDFAWCELSSINSFERKRVWSWVLEIVVKEFLARNTCTHHLAQKNGKNIPYHANGNFLAEKQPVCMVLRCCCNHMCLKSSPGTYWHIMTSASHLGSASGGSSSCVWILKNYIESCQLGLNPETTRNHMSVYLYWGYIT